MAIHKSVQVGDVIFTRPFDSNHSSNRSRIIVYRLETRRGRKNGAAVPMRFKKYFEALNIKTLPCYYPRDSFTAVGVQRLTVYVNPDTVDMYSVPNHILSIYFDKFTCKEMLLDTLKFEIPKPSDSIRQMSNKIFSQNTHIDYSNVLPQDEDGLSELDIFKTEPQSQEDNPYEFKFMV